MGLFDSSLSLYCFNEMTIPMPSIRTIKSAFNQNHWGDRKMLRVCVVLLATIQFATGKTEVKFLKTVELPGINLSLKIMPDSKESPPPPPSVYTYQINRNGVATPCEKFMPAELWRNSQIAGRWTDQSGNILTLATVTCPLIKDFPQSHVLREEYSQKLAEAGDPPPWTDYNLAQWVTDFVGTKISPATPPPTTPPHLANLVKFTLGNQTTNVVAYAFRLNPNAPGQFGATTSWFCAILQVNRDTDREKAPVAMDGDFIKSLAFSGKPRPAGPILPSRSQGKIAGSITNRSAEFITSRQQVADSIRNMQDWWFVETKHYIILSNMKSRNSKLLKHIQSDVEILRACFEQFIPPRTEISSVSVIRIFATPEEYLQYMGAVSKEMQWTYGCWMPDKKELAIRPVEWGDNAEKGQQILETIYHEAFHQYIFYALGQVDASPWFNEGHAELFETSVIGANRLDVTENPDNEYIINNLIKAGNINFKGLLNMTYNQFYATDKEILRANYATAWALIYFLRKAAPPGKPFPYAGINDAYCDALLQLKKADKATDKAFENIDVAQLQADFIEFWKSSTQRARANRNRIFKTFKPSDVSSRE